MAINNSTNGLTGQVTTSGNNVTLSNSAVIGKVLTGYTSGAGTVAATDTILQAIQKLNGNDATNANLTGEVTSVGNATTVTNSAVIGKVLTGYVSGAGTVAATDTILQAIQKLNGNNAAAGWTRVTSDFSTTSTSFVDVTGLAAFSVAANKNYKFEFNILFSSSSTTRGVGFGVNGPAGFTFCDAQYSIPASNASFVVGYSRAYDSGPQSANVDNASVPILAKVWGLLSTGGTAGTFALRMRGENAAATYKVLTGSIGRVVEVL